MIRRLAPLLALPFLMISLDAVAAPRHASQKRIEARPAVHYYRAKPPHQAFTQARRRPRPEHGWLHG